MHSSRSKKKISDEKKLTFEQVKKDKKTVTIWILNLKTRRHGYTFLPLCPTSRSCFACLIIGSLVWPALLSCGANQLLKFDIIGCLFQLAWKTSLAGADSTSEGEAV